MNINSATHSLHHLHVVAVVDGFVQATTLGTTRWFIWPSRETIWVDQPVPGTVARALVRNYEMARHQDIVLGQWSTAAEPVA
jgi:hypothetical protein